MHSETKSRLSVLIGSQFETHFETGTFLSRHNETCQFFKFSRRDGTRRDSRLVSPRNKSRLRNLSHILTKFWYKKALLLHTLALFCYFDGFRTLGIVPQNFKIFIVYQMGRDE